MSLNKKIYFWSILGPFCPNLGKSEFGWKKELCQFLNTPIIYHGAKNQKTLTYRFWEKCQTDRQICRQTDGQTNNDDFIGTSPGGESNYNKFWDLKFAEKITRSLNNINKKSAPITYISLWLFDIIHETTSW